MQQFYHNVGAPGKEWPQPAGWSQALPGEAQMSRAENYLGDWAYGFHFGHA